MCGEPDSNSERGVLVVTFKTKKPKKGKIKISRVDVGGGRGRVQEGKLRVGMVEGC